MVYPKRAAKRTARSMRSLSSAKRSSGWPMVRMIPASRSLRPPTKSSTSFLMGSKQQAVDGEVAALDIFLSTLAEAHLVGMAAVAVADVAAEGRDLDRVARVVSHRNQHDSKLRAHRVGFGKDPHDLVGRGVGGDVVIGGLAAEQQIANASADEVSLVAGSRRVRIICSANSLVSDILLCISRSQSPCGRPGQPRAAVPT